MWEREYYEGSDFSDNEDDEGEDDDEDEDFSDCSSVTIGRKRTGLKILTLAEMDIDAEDLGLILKHVRSHHLVIAILRQADVVLLGT